MFTFSPLCSRHLKFRESGKRVKPMSIDNILLALNKRSQHPQSVKDDRYKINYSFRIKCVGDPATTTLSLILRMTTEPDPIILSEPIFI